MKNLLERIFVGRLTVKGAGTVAFIDAIAEAGLQGYQPEGEPNTVDGITYQTVVKYAYPKIVDTRDYMGNEEAILRGIYESIRESKYWYLDGERQKIGENIWHQKLVKIEYK